MSFDPLIAAMDSNPEIGAALADADQPDHAREILVEMGVDLPTADSEFPAVAAAGEEQSPARAALANSFAQMELLMSFTEVREAIDANPQMLTDLQQANTSRTREAVLNQYGITREQLHANPAEEYEVAQQHAAAAALTAIIGSTHGQKPVSA
jgi:hypothetical protein